MWIAIIIAASVVGLVVVMALVGLALPRDHVVARRVVLARPPAAVWSALTDLDAQPTWRRGLRRIDRIDDARFREVTTQGTIVFEIVEDRPNELRITRIADDKLPFGGRWIYDLAADDGSTRLTITEDGFIKNPVFRFLSKTVFPTASTIEKFLADLAAHLGVPAVVETAPPSATRPKSGARARRASDRCARRRRRSA